MKRHLGLALLLSLGACARPEQPVLGALPPLPPGANTPSPPRISGGVGTVAAAPTPQITLGRVQPLTLPAADTGPAAGDISLDFADTDIRTVIAQVLGTILHVNYTIDPAVHGTATLRTTTPVARAQVLPALEAVLAQNGAAILETGGLYRVVPATTAASSAGLAGGDVIPLRFASAEQLARVLQPYVGAGGHITADPARNVLLVSGEPIARETLVSLIHAFDVDALSGQSYALFPVGQGSAKDFATALQTAFRTQAGGALAGVVSVVPLDRVGSVLLVSSQPRYIEQARRVFALVDRERNLTTRSWHVYYLQNGRSNDVAYVLQQAFTPNNVTATPSRRETGTSPNNGSQQVTTGGVIGTQGFNQSAGAGGGNLPGSISGSTGIGNTGAAGALGTQIPPQPDTTGSGAASASPSANPLFGGLEPGGQGGPGGAQGGADVNALRIIPDPQNNAVLVYSTPAETDTLEAMLHKIDILPLQVRIDAVIAEVTLNDALSYGTQFFFKSGINGALSFGTAATAFANGFPGFVLSGPNDGNVALQALQAVTKVRVLSSPQLLVLDNEAARLQVGNLVPYLTTSSQSTIASNAPVINSIAYRETGVIMQVTPRVNSGGLVTLDISQEVSDVDRSVTPTNSLPSPTFLERNVTSRVVVQDGQTVGLAGLIRDSATTGNSGIPFLKDIPLLGLLAGSQNNSRSRTELLVLITPHVVHDQRDARALTEDLRDTVINAATVPAELDRLRPSGAADPNARFRRPLSR